MKIVPILALTISLAGCLSSPKTRTGLEGKPIPSFDLLLADSTTHFNTKSIPEGEPIVLFYFSPVCPYCRAEMQDILDNTQKLGNIRFYLLTVFPFRPLKNFYDHYQLQQFANITVGRDYKHFFSGYFNTPGVPYLAIYDSHRKLKQVLIGKTDISDIKDIAFE